MRIIQGSSRESVRQDARHALYVEGKDPEAIDPVVLGE